MRSFSIVIQSIFCSVLPSKVLLPYLVQYAVLIYSSKDYIM